MFLSAQDAMQGSLTSWAKSSDRETGKGLLVASKFYDPTGRVTATQPSLDDHLSVIHIREDYELLAARLGHIRGRT